MILTRNMFIYFSCYFDIDEGHSDRFKWCIVQTEASPGKPNFCAWKNIQWQILFNKNRLKQYDMNRVVTLNLGLKRGMKNHIFWSEIGSRFWEPCGTPLPKILSTPSPPSKDHIWESIFQKFQDLCTRTADTTAYAENTKVSWITTKPPEEGALRENKISPRYLEIQLWFVEVLNDSPQMNFSQWYPLRNVFCIAKKVCVDDFLHLLRVLESSLIDYHSPVSPYSRQSSLWWGSLWFGAIPTVAVPCSLRPSRV